MANLPVELVDLILEYAVSDDSASPRWVASLLSISHTVRTRLVPAVYRTLRVTPSNAATVLAQINRGNEHFAHTRVLDVFLGPHERTRELVLPWTAPAVASAFSKVQRFHGPRRLFEHYSATFAPTHMRVEASTLSALLQPRLATGLSGLTHLYLVYLSPVRLPPAANFAPVVALYVPPTLTHVVLAPRAVVAVEWLRDDVVLFLSAPRLTRLLVSLTLVSRFTAGDLLTADHVPVALRGWAAELREPRLYIDAHNRDFDIAYDSSWLVGERLFDETT